MEFLSAGLDIHPQAQPRALEQEVILVPFLIAAVILLKPDAIVLQEQLERLLPELALEHLLLLIVKAAGVEVMPVRSIGPGTAGIVQRLLIERPFNDILRPEFRHPQTHCITPSHWFLFPV